MIFFDSKGTPNENMEDFKKEYSKYYFLGEQINKEIFKKLNQSSPHVENVIFDLLKDGISNDSAASRRDIARILAWKVGKIDHKNSTESFAYISDWKNAEELEGVKIVGKYPIKEAVEYITEKKKELEKKNPQEFINALKDKDIFKGIGTVYMMTLLYFLSHGEYPIYDQFAHKAAIAIYYGVNPGDIYVAPAPGKTETDKFIRVYNEYCWLLKQIFGSFKISRGQDQALWVYGHANIRNANKNSGTKFNVIDFV